MLWRCWLGGRKGIRPVKNWVVGCWHGYPSGARCRLAYGPADATATHCLLLNKIQSGFTFLVPAHPGSPGKGPLNGCVCVCVIKDYIHTLTCTSKHNIKRFIPASSNSGRRCAEEDLILLPCGCREIPRAIMPSSTEAVVLEISASNCRCRVLS